MDMDKEDGEMSDDNAMEVDDSEENNIVLFKAGKEGVFVEHLEKLDASKLDERAKRFGLNLTGNRVVTQKQIDELYTNFGVEGDNVRHFRLDTLHLNGVDGLQTREIFEYLEDFKPQSLEWVNENSCNIVCQDHISAALALLVHSREIKKEVIENLELKSKYHWREGMPHPKKDLILMRFATNADKRITNKKSEPKRNRQKYSDRSMSPVSKNPWGDLCQTWGVYDHQEFFNRKLSNKDFEDEEEAQPTEKLIIKNKSLIHRLGKRKPTYEDSDESSSDSEWKKKCKTPRMRMHADDEETKIKKKLVTDLPIKQEIDSFAPLSIEVDNSQRSFTPREISKLSDKFKSHLGNKGKDNIQSRLGVKVVRVDEDSLSDDCSSEKSSHNHVLSRVQRVKKTNDNCNVWSRLETKLVQSDLRQVLKSKKQKKPEDLRDMIGKTKRSNLCIEIENNYAS